MAARKTKLTVDWIVTTTGEAMLTLRICGVSQQCMSRKYFT